MGFTNSAHISSGEFCLSVLLSPRHPFRMQIGTGACTTRPTLWVLSQSVFSACAPSPLGRHVGLIISRRAQKEMSGVHAWRVIAMMANMQVIRDRPIGQFVRKAVGASTMPSSNTRYVLKLPITLLVLASEPKPATIRLLYPFPKAFISGAAGVSVSACKRAKATACIGERDKWRVAMNAKRGYPFHVCASISGIDHARAVTSSAGVPLHYITCGRVGAWAGVVLGKRRRACLGCAIVVDLRMPIPMGAF